MLDRVGVGTVWTPVSDFSIGTRTVLVPPGSITLVASTFYGVKTSLGTFSLTLPVLAGQTPPVFIDVADIDNNANVNQVTVNAAGGDLISDHGVTSSTFTMAISNVTIRFVANTTFWTALPYGS